MDYSVGFWDRIAERYAKKPVSDQAAYQKKLAVTREYLRADMAALEFGCGTGSTAIELAPLVNGYQGIDVSSKMIEIARQKLCARPVSGLAFTQAPLEEFQVADESLDAVLGMNILHLLNDPDEAIQRVFKMLKPGGVFVSSSVCLADGMVFFRWIAPIGRLLRLIPLVKVFSKETLENSLAKAGFQIDHMQVSPTSASSVFIVALKPSVESILPE